ncbi:hypothetical protein FO519_006483 [Halicephalobus sp. NKZ332]|nr:hypothetical protein FO519_006483 [Halicephalobus sp. NKZ332]
MASNETTKHIFFFDLAIPPSSLSVNYTVNAALDTAAFLFTLYIIVTKSPKSFHVMKHVLLNFLVWGYLFDLQITVAYRPLPLFPAAVLCGNLGLYGLAGWKLISTTVPAIVTLTTIVATFISFVFTLFCLLLAAKSKLKSLTNPIWIVIIVVIHVVPSLPFGYYALVVLDEKLVEEHYGSTPAYSLYLQTGTCTGTVISESKSSSLATLFILGLGIGWLLLILLLWALILSEIDTLMRKNSVKKVKNYKSLLNLMSLRTLCNALVIIFVNGSYRKFVLDRIRSCAGGVKKLRKQGSVKSDNVTMY